MRTEVSWSLAFLSLLSVVGLGSWSAFFSAAQPHPTELLEGLTAELEAVDRQFISRAQWGAVDLVADEDLLSNELPAEIKTASPANFPRKIVRLNADGERWIWPQAYNRSVKRIVLHHTGEYLSSRAEPAAVIRAIFNTHAKGLGWGDIGYHYLIDKYGNVYEGRAGGPGVIGGHTAYHNLGTIGVALMGNFNEQPPTQAQNESLELLLGYLVYAYELDPTAEVNHLGVTAGVISGHQEVSAPGHGTGCPGKFVQESLEDLRVTAHTIAKNRRVAEKDGRDFLAKSLLARTLTRVPAKPYAEVVPQPHFTVLQMPQYRSYQRYQDYQVTVELQNNTDQTWPVGVGLEASYLPEEMSLSELKTRQKTPPGETAIFRGKLAIEQLPNGSYTLRLLPTFELVRSPYFRAPADLNWPLRVAGDQKLFQRSPRSERANNTTRQALQASSFNFNRHHQAFDPLEEPAPEHLIRVELTRLPKNGLALINKSESSLVAGSNFEIQIPAQTVVRLQPQENNQLEVTFADQRWELHQPALVADDPWQIRNYQNEVKGINYDFFRGKLEFDLVDDGIRVVNELPLEAFLWGVAEEPTDSDLARQSLGVLWRSLAYRLSTESPRSPVADLTDQHPGLPYLGFQWEKFHPRQKRLLESTWGTILTNHQDQVISPSYQAKSTEYQDRSPVGRFVLEEAQAEFSAEKRYDQLLKEWLPQTNLFTAYSRHGRDWVGLLD